MNILWVSLYPPLPLNFGGPIGIYKRLVELQKYNDIFLFYIDEEDNEFYNQELSKLCKEVHSYSRNSISDLETLIHIFQLPYTAATRINRIMQKDICNCIENNKIDLINVEFPQMCVNLLKIKKKYQIPLVLHEHNNEWERFMQMSSTVSGIKHFMYQREAKLLYKLENMFVRESFIEHYTFLSNKDRDNFLVEFGIDKKKLSLVPLGADNNPLPIENHMGKNIIFCAAMDSELNQEAAKWFVNEVFAQILKKVPNVNFYIVGRNPSDEIKRISSDKVIVTGTVSDVKDYYQIADLVVIPLLHGGGVKVKLLEAVGYNRNIVTTSVGIEGTRFNWNNQIIVADEAEKFAKACINILTNEKYAKMLRMNTRKFYEKNYTWESIGKNYQNVLSDIVKRKDYEV